jgi:hypothetical protein
MQALGHEDPAETVILMLRFSVAAENHGALRSFLAKAVPYYERPGGIRVRLLQSINSPDEFLEMVEYRDQGTYERDQRRVETDPLMKELLAEWRQLHARPVSVEVYGQQPVSDSRSA